MALFNKLKIMGESLGKTASSMATSASNNLAEESSLLNEKSKITKLESESKGLDNEINLAYSQIGKKLVDYILKTGEVPNIGIEDILSKLDPKLTRKQEIEKEIIEIEKIIKDAQILQEKAKYSEQFEQEIQKLDKALNMGIITKEEKEEKLNNLI